MKKLLLISIVALAAWGCKRDPWDPEKDGYQRTTLIYMAGDSSPLSDGTPDYARQKIRAIVNGYTFNKKSSVLIYNDTRLDVPHLIEVTKDGKLDTIDTYAEENSASGAVLNRVILRAAELRPAKGYGLVVFSHAKGWLPGGAFENPAGFSRSSRTITIDNGDEMEIGDFAAAIPDNMFDLIVLEACHTAGIEMLYPLRHKAEKILGSSAEILVCGFTPVYGHSFDRLAGGDIEGFARMAWGEMQTNGDYWGSGTLALVQTAALEPLADFIRANCDLGRMVNVNDLQRFGRTTGGQRARNLFFDFEHYYGTLLSGDAQRSQLHALVEAAVPWKQATASFLPADAGFVIDPGHYSGMTSYVLQETYPSLNNAWSGTDWGSAIH